MTDQNKAAIKPTKVMVEVGSTEFNDAVDAAMIALEKKREADKVAAAKKLEEARQVRINTIPPELVKLNKEASARLKVAQEAVDAFPEFEPTKGFIAQEDTVMLAHPRATSGKPTWTLEAGKYLHPELEQMDSRKRAGHTMHKEELIKAAANARISAYKFTEHKVTNGNFATANIRFLVNGTCHILADKMQELEPVAVEWDEDLEAYVNCKEANTYYIERHLEETKKQSRKYF